MDLDEITINARHLSSPGPKLLVKQALMHGRYGRMRVIVSGAEAAEDVRSYLKTIGAKVNVDIIADEYHILVEFSSSDEQER